MMSPFVTVQAKVTEELAAATAQVSHLQLKMTAHQKKETELQVQLTESAKETELLRGQVTRLQADLAGKSSEEEEELNGFLPVDSCGIISIPTRGLSIKEDWQKNHVVVLHEEQEDTPPPQFRCN